MHFTIDELPTRLGEELGPTEWREVSQDVIDRFAEATGDAQWIHVDPDRARNGPFGATLAHGYLTLSFCSAFLFELLDVTDATSAINYGLDRVRFPAPVLVGSRLRGRAEIRQAISHDWGTQVTFYLTVEREGTEKPVCVAESLIRYLREPAGR